MHAALLDFLGEIHKAVGPPVTPEIDLGAGGERQHLGSPARHWRGQIVAKGILHPVAGRAVGRNEERVCRGDGQLGLRIGERRACAAEAVDGVPGHLDMGAETLMDGEIGALPFLIGQDGDP